MRNIFKDLIDVQKYRVQRNTYENKYFALQKEYNNLLKSRDMLKNNNDKLRKKIVFLESELKEWKN